MGSYKILQSTIQDQLQFDSFLSPALLLKEITEYSPVGGQLLFSRTSKLALEPTKPPLQWEMGLFSGGKAAVA
jgi:hypothetical protein